MSPQEQTRQAFHRQAVNCERLGSVFSAALCRQLAERLDRSTPIGVRCLDWPGNPDAAFDALPLRLLGGLHSLVRRGEAPALARLYPPNPKCGPETLWPALSDTIARHAKELDGWLDNPPQTNEVGRAPLLFAGFLVLAARSNVPFSLYELGSSAGLNLMLDRYAYRLGGQMAGDAASPLRLQPGWTGPPPPLGEIRVVARRGVDRAPIDIRDPAGRDRLSAYIWPDQAERLARVAAAIEIALRDPPRLDRADAADWIEASLSEQPEAGLCRVVMHTVAFQYFPPASQARITEHIGRVARNATQSAPLAWLRFESAQAAGQGQLRLTAWPDGTEVLLAVADSHGRSIEWLGPGA